MMNKKQILKMTIDLLMTAVLLLLMAYELIGTLPHELLGVGMFSLFLLHHILNWSWLRNLFKGNYSLYRIIQTILVLFILVTIIGSMTSGVVLSKHLFAALPARGKRSAARTIHMLCGYWGFVFMSLHLGLHWGMIVGVIRRLQRGERASRSTAPALRCAAGLIALYGLRSFFYHDLGSYLLLKTQFVFFDFDRPVALFLLDYLSIMGLFVICGCYAGRLLQRKRRHPKS